MFKIGLDLGYGNCKVASQNGEKLCFPSLAKQGAKLDMDKMLGASEDYISTINGTTWYIGKMAAKENRGALRAFDDNQRFNNEAFQAMLATALAVSTHNGDDIMLVTGLPLSSYRDSKNEFLDFLKKFSARVEIDGIEKYIAIKEAYAFPQAAGIFLNPYCNYIKTNLIPDQLVTVIDIGYRTTDVATFQYSNDRFNLLMDNSYTVDIGMSSVFRDLADLMAKDVGAIEISLESAEKTFMSGLCYCKNKPIDYSKHIDELSKKTVTNILDAFKFKCMSKDGSTTRSIILAGGGSMALKNDLTVAFPEATLIQDAQMANAVGFLEVAKRLDIEIFD